MAQHGEKIVPFGVEGEVVKGFGRGAKSLGIPTANFPESALRDTPRDVALGVYYGWASVDDGPVHKMVMNIGYCPYYGNEQKSMETHILHEFPDDFYGSRLKVYVVGYLRPEANFDSLDGLIEAIRRDVRNADAALDEESTAAYKNHDFFKARDL